MELSKVVADSGTNSESPRSELIWPDQAEIRPARPIPNKEIEQVLVWHRTLQYSMLERAFDIGFKLRCWHDLVPRGRWQEWCQQNISAIPERTVRMYLQLWDNNEWIKARIGNALPIGQNVEVEEFPSIRQALALLPKRQSAKPPSKRKVAFRVREVETETAPSIPHDLPVALSSTEELIETEPDGEAANWVVCPHCHRSFAPEVAECA
jgi:hypothetical protein